MIEIDCRKCENLRPTGDGCQLYGNDPKTATAACRSDMFMNYLPRKEKQAEITPGETVWVIERDEDGNAVEVGGYVLLARVAGAVIVSPKVYGRDTLESLMQYYAEEYAEYEQADLAVFPECDCYKSKAAASAAYGFVETED